PCSHDSSAPPESRSSVTAVKPSERHLRLVGETKLLAALSRADVPAVTDDATLGLAVAWAERLIAVCEQPGYLDELQTVLDEIVIGATPEEIRERFVYLLHLLVVGASSALNA